MFDNQWKPTGIDSKQWRHVARACADDFKLLVAAEEWKVLDILYGKIKLYLETVDPSEGQQDFVDLYEAALEYMEANGGNPPPWVVRLVRGE